LLTAAAAARVLLGECEVKPWQSTEALLQLLPAASWSPEMTFARALCEELTTPTQSKANFT
jgi:hypothetical protein